MTFGEFLLASNYEVLYEQLQSIHLGLTKNPLTEGMHKELDILFRQYLFIGGMPESIKRFIESHGNYNEARDVQFQILESYRKDIHKYSSGKLSLVISEVFSKYAMKIGEKVKYSHLSEEKSTYVNEAIETMKDVYLLQKVHHSNCSGLPLKAGESSSIYKIYHLDVGLYHCQMNLAWKDIVSTEESLILTKGKTAEQFVAQHLYLGSYKTRRSNLNYWLRDKSTQKAKIDFIVADQKKSFPSK